ncbi:MAG: hypothetical protein LUQ38_04605 [Methanotrichaceae archaeon]|nr:hypothetical protein [Methanotrichaceae archaeon]
MIEKGDIDNASKVLELKDLVNYQDGSVVSREIIRKYIYRTIILFAFKKIWSLHAIYSPASYS